MRDTYVSHGMRLGEADLFAWGVVAQLISSTPER